MGQKGGKDTRGEGKQRDGYHLLLLLLLLCWLLYRVAKERPIGDLIREKYSKDKGLEEEGEKERDTLLCCALLCSAPLLSR